MRTSDDVYESGRLIHGFDYDKQAWVKDGKYLRCGHPDSTDGRPIKCGCYGRAHEGEETQTKNRDAKRIYVLTDGDEHFQEKEMTREELRTANVEAKAASDGNFCWLPKDTLVLIDTFLKKNVA